MSKILDSVIKEMAAAGSTGAGSIGGFRGSLFGGGLIDVKRAKKQQTRVMKKIGYYPINEQVAGETDFDAADVFSKLDAAESRADINKDTVAFGLEDDEGGIVKVYVKTEDADEFESTLASMLAGVADEDDDDEISALEIAEVLFKLKDKFEIVDVEWGDVEGDEEEEQEIEGEGGGEPGPAGEAAVGDMEGAEGAEGGLEGGDELGLGGAEGGEDLDLSADIEGAGEEDAKSALDAVISMMKADAEARQAEAEARKAEARATEARYAAAAAESKIKQEEEVIDMEAHNDAKKQQDSEAKKLADLAKYRHEVAGKAEDQLGGEADMDMDVEEEEERGSTISRDDLAKLIFKHLRHR